MDKGSKVLERLESKQRTRHLLPTVELWGSDISIEHIVLIQITREWLTHNLPTYICLLRPEFFQGKKKRKDKIKTGRPHGAWEPPWVVSKEYIEINKMVPQWAAVSPKCALTRSQATFLGGSRAIWWRSQRYHRWLPRPSGRHSPLCRCRSCRGWGTQKSRWHKGTWVVCRRRFRRTLHRSGPRSQCRRRTPSSSWCTCLRRAELSQSEWDNQKEILL